ncbi:hypothetical protein AC249_AIPGENE974 [Exaiptasia diaphana]|nr:hypothetical protein AC249_AIPGENE974 [Exaiptasia diaphana]
MLIVINAWEGFGWKKVTEFPFWLRCLVIPLMYLQKQFMLGYGSLPLALLHFNLIHKNHYPSNNQTINYNVYTLYYNEPLSTQPPNTNYSQIPTKLPLC